MLCPKPSILLMMISFLSFLSFSSPDHTTSQGPFPPRQTRHSDRSHTWWGTAIPLYFFILGFGWWSSRSLFLEWHLHSGCKVLITLVYLRGMACSIRAFPRTLWFQPVAAHVIRFTLLWPFRHAWTLAMEVYLNVLTVLHLDDERCS